MPVSTPRTEPAASPFEPAKTPGAIPPLENGQRLTRAEFERRYDAMPNLKKAELIEGVVHLPSPVRYRQHGSPHSTLVGWLFLYRARTPGTRLADNASVRLDLVNMPQPDATLFIDPEFGGQASIDPDDYLSGGPDLVAEVSASSIAHDSGEKRRAYERNHVREYIVWRVLDRQVDWYILRGESYEKQTPAGDGILRSTVFPGLWLDPSALIRDDCDAVLEVLARGLETPEHAAFVAQLEAARTRPTA